jgi:hypothetical protein
MFLPISSGIPDVFRLWIKASLSTKDWPWLKEFRLWDPALVALCGRGLAISSPFGLWSGQSIHRVVIKKNAEVRLFSLVFYKRKAGIHLMISKGQRFQTLIANLMQKRRHELRRLKKWPMPLGNRVTRWVFEKVAQSVARTVFCQN